MQCKNHLGNAPNSRWSVFASKIERLRDRLETGDPDLEPDELQLAIDAAQIKRRDLLDVQPRARQSAKILTMLPKAAEAYRKQIERVTSPTFLVQSSC